MTNSDDTDERADENLIVPWELLDKFCRVTRIFDEVFQRYIYIRARGKDAVPPDLQQEYDEVREQLHQVMEPLLQAAKEYVVERGLLQEKPMNIEDSIRYAPLGIAMVNFYYEEYHWLSKTEEKRCKAIQSANLDLLWAGNDTYWLDLVSERESQDIEDSEKKR